MRTVNARINNVTFTGPKLIRDARLNTGSLLLLNPAHGSGAWAAGPPKNGDVLPNIAAAQVRKTLGAASDALVSASWANTGTTAAEVVTERTTKGGVHVLPSQVNDNKDHFQRVDMPAALTAYLKANTGHSLYMSLFARTTRVGASSLLARISSATGNVLRQSIAEGTSNGSPVIVSNPTSGSTLIARSTSQPSPGMLLMDIATSTVPTSWTAGSDINPALMFFGPTATASLHKAPGWVLYDFYLEDLTISGATYADAHTRALASYASQITDPSGIYAGDAIPTPATSFA